jgi:hypothetical protein
MRTLLCIAVGGLCLIVIGLVLIGYAHEKTNEWNKVLNRFRLPSVEELMRQPGMSLDSPVPSVRYAQSADGQSTLVVGPGGKVIRVTGPWADLYATAQQKGLFTTLGAVGMVVGFYS